jgi:hypothetical protein
LLSALHAVTVAGTGEILARALTVFFAFIPLFALFETRRMMGEDEFLSLFLGRKLRPEPARDSHIDARRPTTLKMR